MLYRKVLRLTAEDSPNVKLALQEIAEGKEPSHRQVVPGVLSYRQYLERRQFWSKMRQDIGLDANFPEEGALMFPPAMLDACKAKAEELKGNRTLRRRAKAIGGDCAEGGDSTAAAVIDELGLLDLRTQKTPDTSIIPGWFIGLMREHKVLAKHVALDAGGGGYEHACVMRAEGLQDVKTVRFGESAGPEFKPYSQGFKERLEKAEERYVYQNRRVQMYHELSLACAVGFAIPKEQERLLQQLSIVPKQFDKHGKGVMTLPDKGEMYGEESPDEADSLVLAWHAMTSKGGLPSRSGPVALAF